jgi:hypothetical protein
MSVIKLNDLSGSEVNVVASKIVSFEPLLNEGEPAGSHIVLSSGLTYDVTASTRSLRGYVNKALASAVEEAA